MALNNEGNLVILSPFNEPSGAAFFKNYAPAYFNGRGSGLSYDWHVHITGGDTNEPQSCWPGTDAIFMAESGTTHLGYRAQGTAETNAAANNTAAEKVLIIGPGGWNSKSMLSVPPISQSGFTVGFWISPQSDGFIKHATTEILAKRHAVLQKGATNDALYLGVSGARQQAAQFTQDVFASGLRAFAVVTNGTAANDRRLDIPIESGAYTHVTFTYKHFGTANEITLYKNGVSGAAIITPTQLVSSNAQWSDRPLTLGGCIDTNAVGTDRYDEAAGWGHLVSGVYAYDRILSAAEIAQIHNQGGLQVDSALAYPVYQEVTISDPSIVTYAPFISPGYIDASRHHLNLFANKDEGSTGNNMFICPGPFNHAMAFNDTTNSIDMAIATPSGTLIELLYGGNGSFTIAGWFFQDDAAGVTSTTFDNTTLFSFGSVGPTGEFGPARQTGGFQVSASGAANGVRMSARLYDGGLVTPVNTTVLYHNDSDLFLSMAHHAALVYDEQTKGIAFYVDGLLAQSGTMPNSMLPQMQRLAGSGYPLVFIGGVPNEATDIYSNIGGDDCAVTDIFIANRPLLPAEVKFIAESGVNVTPTYYSVHDPRLRGYWDCTGSGTNDLMIRDTAMIFTSGGIPGHLVQCAADPLWDIIEANVDKGHLGRIDRFSVARDPIRGITSGAWAVMAATDGIIHAASVTGEWSRTSSSDFCQRFRMFAEERDLRAPAHINEYIVGFNVTPSGNLPSGYFGQAGRETNSMLTHFGEVSATDSFFSYLTLHADPASGVVIVFESADGTVLMTPLVSGSLTNGIQSRVMFHAKPLLPFNNDTVTPIECSLYINGNAVARNVFANNAAAGPAARLYDSDANGAADNWTLQIGGRGTTDTFSSQVTSQDGLGQIFMNGIFWMVGTFSRNDLLRLAASGINSSKTISNFSNSIPSFPLTIQDPALEGYWRFSGPDAGSGINDLSSKNNSLTAIARSVGSQSAFTLRYLPMGFVNAPTPRQASGITYNGTALSAANPPPFAVSGAQFQIPQSGFSVGFWIAPREATAAGDAITILSYGVVPSSITSAVFTDSSWAIGFDDDSNLCLWLSQDGKMKLSNVATPASSQSKCTIMRTAVSDPGPDIEIFRRGYFNPGHIDSLEHVIFTFNHSANGGVSGIAKGYLNGEKVSEMVIPASGFHQPMVPESRFISFMIPQTGTWAFGTARGAQLSVITDVFYMSRPITDEEARYVALNGIGPPSVTEASGAVGGYVVGLAGADGTIGAYMNGLDTGSGLVGGYINGVNASSDNIGGYLPALSLPSGYVGAYINATIGVSGAIGGYIASKDMASGVIGSWMRGAVRNVHYFDAAFSVEFFSFSDFDAKFRVNQTNTSDFDAQIVVFQSEQPPGVDIIVPSTTLFGTSIPWNQYFVGSGRAVQGKSIVQAKFTFGDFNAPVLVSQSGNDLYPVSHTFDQSGVYIVRFSVIDSNGQHNSATRIINLASGVSPVNIALSGVPGEGFAPLSVQFNQVVISEPNNVAIVAQLLSFDDGQESININPLHVYTEVGVYRPVWVVRDSRGCIWGDSLVAGVNN